jgi:hypothetical protein
LTSERRASAVARFAVVVAPYVSRRPIGADECAGACGAVDETVLLVLLALLAPCVGVTLAIGERSPCRVALSGRSAGACCAAVAAPEES